MTVINQKIPAEITAILYISCSLTRLDSDIYGTLEIMANVLSLLHRSTSTIALLQTQVMSKELGQGTFATLPDWTSIERGLSV
jgi:hypothetical protein